MIDEILNAGLIIGLCGLYFGLGMKFVTKRGVR